MQGLLPADHLSFPFNPSMGNRLHTVKQILQVDMYEIVDLKVKIITKSQGKPSVITAWNHELTYIYVVRKHS